MPTRTWPIFPDASFDYVILSQTIQAMRDPRQVLQNMLRIGRFGIVSFTNYAYWRARCQLLLRGRMPTARCQPEPWFATSNIHPCTLEDFERLCDALGLRIEHRMCLAASGEPNRLFSHIWLDNLLSEQALFLLSSTGVALAPLSLHLDPLGGRERPRHRHVRAPPALGHRGLERRGIDLLLGDHQQHAGKVLRPAQAHPFPGDRGAQDQTRAQRRDEQRASRFRPVRTACCATRP